MENIDLTALENRIYELDGATDYNPLNSVFDTVVEEFEIPNSNQIAEKLGCKCPFALLDWIEAEQSPDTELAVLYAETERLLADY